MREAPLGPHPGFSPPIEASHWLELEPTTPDKWVRRGSLFEASGRAFDHSSWLLLVVGAILVYTGKRRRDEGIKNFPFTSISFLTQHPMPRPSTPYPVVIRARSSSAPMRTVSDRSTMDEDYSSDFPVPNASPAAPSSPEAVSMDLDLVVEAPAAPTIPAPSPISSP
ncbi:hypothetical protein PGTUg99_030819 [Puccinia graminis f. sp. tritici]|uniref:Uncharacterized protein n=1 Tax=Puccinia graminis f. sp. tritici TaxID=56615 RepID=A0A5B0QS31_PUCGR|nr:hypothetical protein PGTUg99_030819 [Puccinia graminis f. sp. tritici]